MGRIFETRKTTMFARWDRMAKQFTRIGKDISIAVKQGGGPNPDNNPALRRCILNAKGVNMPKDRIEAAIRRATDKLQSGLEEFVYEGYAPHGVAVLVETTTNNSTRTVANIRMYFNRAGGNLSTSGSLNFIFNRIGEFYFHKKDIVNPEEFELELIDYGLYEMGEGTDNKYIVRCNFKDFGKMSEYFLSKNVIPISQEISRIPLTYAKVNKEQEKEVLVMVDKIEQDDDVQKVYHNLA